MKATQIRFFSRQENSEQKTKTAPKSTPATGYISGAGKLVFPAKTVAQLGFEPDGSRFKIGTQEGKRKLKILYLIPDTEGDPEAFDLEKAAKSYTISLPIILQKGGIDYAKSKYVFTVKPFEYESGVSGLELALASQEPKAEYTGKPRGRKSKQQEDAV
jgi:hypothetical protein